MKKQYAFLVDAARCIGCFTCAMACRNYNHPEEGVIWRQVYPLKEPIYPHRGRAFFSLACNHCENPACLKACPTDAYSKRQEDGVVMHHPERCIGCSNCVRSCPYGVPQYNPVAKKAEKCSFCYPRLDAGLMPACIQSCPTDALQLIDLSTFSEATAIQYPQGMPRMEEINPSTRFILPKLPQRAEKNS